jgi:hypothetical protein
MHDTSLQPMERMSSVPIDRILHATLSVSIGGGCRVVMDRGALCRIKTRGFVLLHHRRLPAFGISKTVGLVLCFTTEAWMS